MHKRAVTIAVVLLLALSFPTFLGPARGAAVSWSPPTPLDQAPGADILPTSLETIDGTLWMAWQSNRANPSAFISDIYYRTYSGGVWSLPANLTTPGSNVNKAAPSLAQTPDGYLWLFYSANTTGTYKIYYSIHVASSWTPPVNATSGPSGDCSPSTVVGKDGTLWLFWTRGVPCSTGTTSIYYKTLRAGAWSKEALLVSASTLNSEPKAYVMNDGRVWVVFAEFLTTNKEIQTFNTIYNGTAWSVQSQITSSNVNDDHPAISQDRNGTIWLFWTREVPIGTGLFDDQIFSKFSIDNGVTWSADAQMTFDPGCCTTDSWAPTAAQSSDRTVWLFFASSLPFGGNFDIYYMRSSPIYPVHNVVVSLITTSPACPFPLLAKTSPTCLYPGGLKTIGESPLVTFSVTVKDSGDFNETVTLQASAVNGTQMYPAGSTATGTVMPGHFIVLSIVWNTTSTMKPGRYGIQATISGVTGESIGNIPNNTLTTGNLVHLIPLGDIDQDGSVTFIDASTVAYAFQSTPASPRWNPFADPDGDFYVSFIDVSIMAINYGIVT